MERLETMCVLEGLDGANELSPLLPAHHNPVHSIAGPLKKIWIHTRCATGFTAETPQHHGQHVNTHTITVTAVLSVRDSDHQRAKLNSTGDT